MKELDNTISVPYNELEELKRQAEEINRRIKELTYPNNFSSHIREKPLGLPTNLDYSKPVFGFRKMADMDAWNCFVKLGKLIHRKDSSFYDEYVHDYPYAYLGETRIVKTREAPLPKIKELTEEQIKISADMLDEMISVYNKYMIMLHEYVDYYPMKGKEAIRIKVLKPGEEEE